MKRHLTTAAAVGAVAIGMLWTFSRGDVALWPSRAQTESAMHEAGSRSLPGSQSDAAAQASAQPAFDALAASIRAEALHARPVSEHRSNRQHELHLIAMSSGRDRWHPADWSNDGILDERDFELFIDAFRRGCSSADLTGDGMLDINDVNAFLELLTTDWQQILAC